MVTPVAGLVATALLTLTRPAAISSLACSRERARPRRTSSASSLRRRGGTAQPWAAWTGSPAPLSTCRSDSWACSKTATCSDDREVVEPAQGGDDGVDRRRHRCVSGSVCVGRGLVALAEAGVDEARSWPTRYSGRLRRRRSRQAVPCRRDGARRRRPRPATSRRPTRRPSTREPAVLDRGASSRRGVTPSSVTSGAGCGSARAPRSGATYVGRSVLRRAHQLLEPGDAGQHEQAVPAHRHGALDVGVQPVADHQRVARRRPG